MSNIMNNQGAPYGQQPMGGASSTSQTVNYKYRQPDPNDPLEMVPIPDRLYHNDEPHVYYQDSNGAKSY